MKVTTLKRQDVALTNCYIGGGDHMLIIIIYKKYSLMFT